MFKSFLNYLKMIDGPIFCAALLLSSVSSSAQNILPTPKSVLIDVESVSIPLTDWNKIIEATDGDQSKSVEILERGGYKVSANPRAIVANGDTGTITTQQQLPYGPNIAPKGSSRRRNSVGIGITIVVVPKINMNGTIGVSFQLQDVELTGQNSTLGGAPYLDSQQVSSTSSLYNGQTIILLARPFPSDPHTAQVILMTVTLNGATPQPVAAAK